MKISCNLNKSGVYFSISEILVSPRTTKSEQRFPKYRNFLQAMFNLAKLAKIMEQVKTKSNEGYTSWWLPFIVN